MSSPSSPITGADYQPTGFHKFSIDHPTATKLAFAALGLLFVGGGVALGFSIHDIQVHETSSAAIGLCVGGSLGIAVSAALIGLAIRNIREGRRLLSNWSEINGFKNMGASATGTNNVKNQDKPFVKEISGGILFGIFDGKGENGDGLALQCVNSFARAFEQHYDDDEEDDPTAAGAMRAAADVVQAETALIPQSSATMSVTFINSKDLKRTTAIYGNVGLRVFTPNGEKAKIETQENPNSPPAEAITIVEGQAEAGELYVVISEGVSNYSNGLSSVIKENWGKGDHLAELAVNSAKHPNNGDDRTAVMVQIPAAKNNGRG